MAIIPKRKIKPNEKAQTLTELAILGSLIIVAFSFLIQYSEKINRQQSYVMQTFRAALKEARSANDSASYTKVAFRRMPNVASPMELGQLQTFSGSSNVLWATGDKFHLDINNQPDGLDEEKEGVNKYQLNEGPARDVPILEEGDEPREGDIKTSESNFTNAIDSTNSLVKDEGAGSIVTTKSLNARDAQTATIDIDPNVDADPWEFEYYLGADGKYYIVDEGLSRSRSMQ